MKTVIDIRCLMDRQYTGVGWYAYYLIENLLKIDQKNEYVLFYNSSKQVELPKFAFPNVTYRGFNYPNKLFNLSLNFLSRPQLDLLVETSDVFFSPNFHFLSVSEQTKLVVTVHDLSFLIYPPFFTLKQRLWHKLILSRSILGRAEKIMVDSYSTKTDLLELLNINENKVEVNYPGVAEKYFSVLAKEELLKVKEKYSLPDNFVLCLGTLEPRKNLASAIKAFNNLSGEEQLVIAGGTGWKATAVKELIENNQQIKLIGYVAEADKPALYQLSKLLLYPSFYEGFGLPPIEAMASGTPVIVGYNSSQSEVVGEAGLLVDPFDVGQITLALKGLLNDSELRNELIIAGRERAREFSWSKTAERTLNVFRELKNPQS
jgi:glycosyltransferase involved in cell wall biosynthesis